MRVVARRILLLYLRLRPCADTPTVSSKEVEHAFVRLRDMRANDACPGSP
jgi:hypothetical protein